MGMLPAYLALKLEDLKASRRDLLYVQFNDGTVRSTHQDVTYWNTDGLTDAAARSNIEAGILLRANREMPGWNNGWAATLCSFEDGEFPQHVNSYLHPMQYLVYLDFDIDKKICNLYLQALDEFEDADPNVSAVLLGEDVNRATPLAVLADGIRGLF
jgi:hypothetical protein